MPKFEKNYAGLRTCCSERTENYPDCGMLCGYKLDNLIKYSDSPIKRWCVMRNEIKKILSSIDIKLNHEVAKLKAQMILEKGIEALKALSDIGFCYLEKDMDNLEVKRMIDTIIFVLSYPELNSPKLSINDLKKTNCLLFLCAVASHGNRTPNVLLHKYGFKDSDIAKYILLSLPVFKERYEDLRISLDDALEDIKLSRIFSGKKGFEKNYYVLGDDGNDTHKIYRVGDKTFALTITTRAS